MNILVLGGTKYFGKRLISLLLENKHRVTVATRGRTDDGFGDRVQRYKIDRNDPKTVRQVAELEKWDVVFDQICFSPNEALSACEAFEGRVGKYIHTSTGSVYNTPGERLESNFDPFHYPIQLGDQKDFDYGEGKRQAEAVFFQRAKFPVAAMRIPIVLGADDFTGRLEFHIHRIYEGRPIVIPNLEAETCFISSAEAARFLFWLAKENVQGPINACSDGRISIRKIIEIIEKRLGKKAVILEQGEAADKTPLIGATSHYNNNSRAKSLGFQFESLDSWFPKLVDELCAGKKTF